MATSLSTHFTLEELTATQQRGLDNTATPEVQATLQALCQCLLEPVHDLVGHMHVNSGYRSPEVNAAVHGQPTSQHCKGEAADLVPLNCSLKEMATAVIDSDLPYDQLIYEFGSWVHLSYTADRPPRRQALMIGPWTAHKYLPFDAAALP